MRLQNVATRSPVSECPLWAQQPGKCVYQLLLLEAHRTLKIKGFLNQEARPGTNASAHHVGLSQCRVTFLHRLTAESLNGLCLALGCLLDRPQLQQKRPFLLQVAPVGSCSFTCLLP